jgi:hypothetical protein
VDSSVPREILVLRARPEEINCDYAREHLLECTNGDFNRWSGVLSRPREFTVNASQSFVSAPSDARRSVQRTKLV